MSIVQRGLPLALIAASATLAVGGPQDAAAPGTGVGEVQKVPEPLNVVLIVLDDVGVDQVGVFESRYPRTPGQPVPHPAPCTPFLDQLARDGLLFTNAWAAPRCSPTRSLILTGRRVRDTGIGTTPNPLKPANVGLAPGVPTLAHLAPRSAAVGKWHLADETQKPSHPLAAGFQSFAGTFYNLNAPPQDGPSYYDWQKWDGLSTTPIRQFEYATRVTARDAIAAIDAFEAQPDPEPWLLYVGFHAAHRPLHCPEDPDCPDASCPESWCHSCATCSSGGAWSSPVCRSRAMVQAMDAELGTLLGRIDPTDTAVIVLGDNGTDPIATLAPFVPSHAKNTVYQDGVLVPLIIRMPGMESAQGDVDVVHELACASDLFRTTADLMRLGVPPEPLLDSVSLAQYLPGGYQQPGQGPREVVWTEMFQPNFTPVPGGGPPDPFVPCYHHRAVRNATHKLIRLRDPYWQRTEFYRLYDPSNPGPPPHDPASTPDPHESFDLMAEPGSWDVVDHLAYAGLSERMAADASFAWPVGAQLVAPTLLVEAHRTDDGSSVQTVCGAAAVAVAFSVNGASASTRRAFLEWDLAGLPPDAAVLQAELVLQVQQGGAESTQVLARRTLAHPSALAQDCAALFDSAAEDVWGAFSGLIGQGTSYVLPLDPAALGALQQGLCQPSAGPDFSLVLMLEDESPTGQDEIRLEPNASVHGLRITLLPDPCRCGG